MHIHIADAADQNVRMILPPTSGGQAPIVYTYTVSGLAAPYGMTFDGTHIHISDIDDDNVRMILPPTSGGQASIVRTYTVSGLAAPYGMTFDGTHIHIADIVDDNVRMILPPTSGGQASIVRTYTVSGLNNPNGMAFDGTHIHIVDSLDDNVRMILPPTSGGQASIVRTYTVSGLNNPGGMTFDGTHVHLVDNTDDNVRMILPPTSGGQAATVYTYTVSGLNVPTGMTFDGGLQQQATLTLSTTDTDIRVGEPVDIDIDSDIDISNFVASDITVTNGTRGALTINSVTSATLRVTAGSAGTMTVAIAEDAVDPGNAAASQDFTVNARVTATITFDDSEGESGGSTGVNIALSESVTGLLLSHLTASAGTLSNVTGSGTSWEADLAFPATGSGTIDIDLAIDSTTPQNAAASASIDYAEAAVALALGWTVPTAPVGNTFSATLTSNHPITGVELNDFRFRISDNSEGAVALTAANTTLTAVAGTNNWRLDIVLVGTFDADYTIRLRGNTVQYDGSNYPPAFLFSDAFSIDSSIGADTVPEAPTSLTATAQTNGTSMALDWDAPNNDGGAAISDYDVSSDDGATWNAIGSTNTTYTVTGLDKGTEYTFRVRAVNSVGDGTASASVTETTDTTVPGAPTSLSASVTSTTADLSWTAPTDDGGSPITEYQYRFTTGTTAGGTWTDTNSTTPSFTISSLTANTEYTFQVRTVTTVGSSQSNPSVTETTLAAAATVPGAPTGLSATAQTGGTSVELDWRHPQTRAARRSAIMMCQVMTESHGLQRVALQRRIR